MLETTMFTKGENEVQDYYYFNNEATKELIQIIKNKSESHWFGMYDNQVEGRFFVIPIECTDIAEHMLTGVCDSYNNGKEEAHYQEAPEANVSKIAPTLFNITDCLGRFPIKSAERIQAYLNEPTVERWDDISGIIVKGWKTVWQLMIETDSSFPRTGRSTDITGKIISDWAKIPAPLEVLRAIKKEIQVA